MPIFSFLVYPEKNSKDQLVNDLSQMDFCEVKVSDNEDVIILLTETPSEEVNNKLIKTLRDLPSVQSLSMTFGHTD